MAYITIKLNDTIGSELNITYRHRLKEISHIKRMLFRDSLIIGDIEYKYLSRNKLLKDIEFINRLAKLLDEKTILNKITKYRLASVDTKVYVKDLLTINSYIIKNEINVNKANFLKLVNPFINDTALTLTTNDKTFDKKKKILKNILNKDVFYINTIEEIEEFRNIIKPILKYK